MTTWVVSVLACHLEAINDRCSQFGFFVGELEAAGNRKRTEPPHHISAPLAGMPFGPALVRRTAACAGGSVFCSGSPFFGRFKGKPQRKPIYLFIFWGVVLFFLGGGGSVAWGSPEKSKTGERALPGGGNVQLYGAGLPKSPAPGPQAEAVERRMAYGDPRRADCPSC